MQRVKWEYVALVAILILATGVRLYKLTDIPSGFFTDEASVGLNAYTILTHGTDEFGTPFPFFFRSFGEYKGGMSVYTAIPFIFIFGLTEFAVRLTSVAFALLSIIAVYLLALELFRQNQHRHGIALLSALFLAISPWHIHYSRVGWDAYMQYIFFTSLALYVFLKALHNPKLLPISIALFGITLYGYFAARVFVPLLGIFLICTYFRFFITHKKYSVISAIVLLIVIAPFIHHHLKEEAWSTHWKQQNIFFNPPSNGQSAASHFVYVYLSHFSTDFLFTKGHIDMPGSGVNRHSVRGMGELYLFQLPFIIFGIIALWNDKNKTPLVLLVAWLILYPFAASLTTESAATSTRSVIGVVPFQFLTAVGIFSFFSFISERLVRFKKTTRTVLRVGCIIMLVFIVSFSFSHYLKRYFVEYPHYSADYWGWQYGARDIIDYFLSVQDKYDELYLSPEFNGAEVLVKFYSANNAPGCTKCFIGGDDKYSPDKKQLFSFPLYKIKQSKYNTSFEMQKEVRYPYTQWPGNVDVAFVIGEIKKPANTTDDLLNRK